MIGQPKSWSDRMKAMVRRQQWLVLHLGLLAVVFGVHVFSSRGQWFYGDEWDFLVFRGIFGTHKLGLWAPHNEHWSTLPILVWRGIFAVVGIKSYWPYMGVLFAVHLTTVHLLWRVLNRLPNVSPALAFGGAAVFGLYGAGWENLLWAFQIGFIGSLAAGLALVLAVDEEGSRRRVLAVSCGAIGSLLISGISVVMVGALGVIALARWGWRRALAVTAPAGLVYIVWLQRYGSPAIEQQNQLHGTLGDAPRYAFEGLAGTLEPMVGGVDYLGAALLLALAAYVVFRARWLYAKAPAALALGAGAVAMYVVISQGRGALADPATSRYLYLSAAMLIPLVAMAVGALCGRRSWAHAAGFVAACVVAAGGANTLYARAVGERQIDLSNRGQLLASLELADSGVRILSDQPLSPFAPDVSLADLRSLRERGKLFAGEPNARDRAGAQIALRALSVRGAPADRPLGAASVVNADGVSLRPTGGGCLEVDPNSRILFIDLQPGNAFSVTADRAGIVDIYFGFEGGYGGPRRIFLQPGETQTFASNLVGPAAIQFHVGATRLCGVDLGDVAPAPR